MEIFMINKISPHPSFPKRGIWDKVFANEKKQK